MKPPIITDIQSLEQLQQILGSMQSNNVKMTIIKLGAKWCQPCKRIEPMVYQWMDKLPDNIQVCLIDIDISFNFYSFLKSKRIVNGVPALLAYYRKNVVEMIPDDVVIGADTKQVHLFFERCLLKV
jgi:thiol-disulfide isomerase/thioredoxin